MSDSVTVESGGVLALAARFAELGAQVRAGVAAADETIAGQVQEALVALYGPHLAKYWQVTAEAAQMGAGKTLGAVRVSTEDKRVLGYEFGTRPHSIRPRAARALRFTTGSGGGAVFAREAHHPGTRPHNKRSELRAALAEVAGREWQAVVAAALDGAAVAE